MGDTESLDEIPGHLAKFLDPKRNYHWSGVGRKLELERHLPRTFVAEYTTWFQWYMSYQRFRAFQTAILIDPLATVSNRDTGGFIDGLLTRLMTKVPQVIVVAKGTTEQTQLQADDLHVNGVLMSLLFGTRLSRSQLTDVARLAFVPIPDQMLQKTLDNTHWQYRCHKSRYELTDDDEKLVQGMVPEWKSHGPGEPPEEVEQLFQRPRKREYIRPEAKWIEEEVTALVRTKGWFTTQTLGDYFQKRFREFASSRKPPPKEAYPYVQREKHEQILILLSPSIIRRVCDSLAAIGRLTKHTWYREIGRPAVVYTEPGSVLPFKEDARCGQCAFYRPSKSQCRIWSLVNWKYPFYDQRWKQPESGVGEFEIYKMKNSYKIGPHSSACTHFLGKKRDHLRKSIPIVCEICAAPLSKAEADKLVVCQTCGTKYVPWWGRVRVQTSHEHEFRRRYRDITGSETVADLRDWKAELARSPPREFEMNLDLDSEPDASVSAEQLELKPNHRHRPAFSPSLQFLVDEKAQASGFSKLLSLAMMQSALNATQRLAAVGHLDPTVIEEATQRQRRHIALVSESRFGPFLTYEAHAMKEYWSCYDSVLKPALQWFGPRKRYRFVSEYVDDVSGRAKGYSALHAAINYLHQRRLRQALRINAEVGFEGTTDGFLHRERYNSRHIGLLFDMIDPFKFADRESLLAVVLNRGITWRDFKRESDRRNSTFYYPSQNAVTILERVGVDADHSAVRYQGINSSLNDAYKRFASSLLDALSRSTTEGFEPFVYVLV